MIILLLFFSFSWLYGFDRSFQQQEFSWGTSINKPQLPLELNYSFEGTFVSTLSSAQYAQYNNVDPVFLWPLQPVEGAQGGNLSSQPITDLMYAFPNLTLSTQSFRLGAFDVSSTITGEFGGLVFAGGLLGFKAGSIQLQSEDLFIRIGQLPHPFAPVELLPNMVAFNQGAPLVPCYALHPQVQTRLKLSQDLSGTLTLFTQYLFTDNGPDGFSSEYLRRSGIPEINVQLQYGELNNSSIGVGINYKKLIPRKLRTIFTFDFETSGPYLNTSSISFWLLSIFGTAQTSIGNFKSQFFVGSGGTDMYLLGGYGVSQNGSVTKQEQYTPIYFADIWTDYELPRFFCRLRPALFIGYTQLLGSSNNLVFAESILATPQIYTIDQAAQRTLSINPLTGTEYRTTAIFGQPLQYINNLVRVAPRVWTEINEHLSLGIECNWYWVRFGKLIEKAKPIDIHTTTFLATSIGAAYEY